jgi:integrase
MDPQIDEDASRKAFGAPYGWAGIAEVARPRRSQSEMWSLSGLGASDRPRKARGNPANRRRLYTRITTAAIELLLFTGCRLSEVLNLCWDQVDFEAGTITLVETKAGRPQIVVMNAPARQVLKQLEKAKASPWVLPSTSDAKRPLSKSAIEAVWQRMRTAAKLDDARLHDLRHTVGTYAGQSGANAFLVRDLLRHKNLAMTGRYVNHADDPVRTLSDQVGERIAAGLAGRKGGEVVALKRGA